MKPIIPIAMVALLASCNTAKKMEEPKYIPTPIRHPEVGEPIQFIEASDSLTIIEEDK